MNPEVEVRDEEDAYVQALERAKAPPETAPPEEVAPQPEPPGPAPEAGSSVVEAEKPSDDLDLESLPAPVRARLEKAEAEIKAREAEIARERNEKQAALNRLQPAQRKLAELERQTRELAQKPAPSPQPAAPVVGSPKWDKWAKDYPDEAEAILEREHVRLAEVADLKAQVAQLRQAVEPRLGAVDEVVHDHTTQREMAALTQAHPDWSAVVQPKDEADQAVVVLPARQHDGSYQNVEFRVASEFADWLNAQHPDKARWYASDHASDLIALLHDYKRDAYVASQHRNAPATPPQRPAPDIDPSPRARQTNPVSRNAGPIDPEEEAYAATVERYRAGMR